MKPSRIIIILSLLFCSWGCETAADAETDPNKGAGGSQAGTGGSDGADAATGGSDAGGEDQSPAPDAGTDSGSETPRDGGAGGLVGLSAESCCEEHAEPGCLDGVVQDCVCDKLPECCTDKWDLPCVLIVQQKWCEEGVRECVCGDEAEGGWEQTECCETSWSDFCGTVAESKCDAAPACK